MTDRAGSTPVVPLLRGELAVAGAVGNGAVGSEARVAAIRQGSMRNDVREDAMYTHGSDSILRSFG